MISSHAKPTKRTLLVLVLLLSGTLLVGCQPRYVDWDGSGAAATQLMNRVEAANIAREANGDKPPKGSATWRDYWRGRFAVLQPNSGNPDQGSGSPGHIMGQTVLFIKQKRAEAGLPPVD